MWLAGTGVGVPHTAARSSSIFSALPEQSTTALAPPLWQPLDVEIVPPKDASVQPPAYLIKGIGRNRKESEGIKRSQKRSESISSDQKRSEAIRRSQKESEAVRSNQKQSEAIRSNQKQSEGRISAQPPA